MKNTFALFFLLFSISDISGQTNSIDINTDLEWRNIGPANMMGRIAAIEALDHDYRTVLVASASGGVFKSTNAGITWDPIFDTYGAGSIGAVAFYQKEPDIIWVGTGEAANRNSSAWGDGIYKSTDGGKSFENMGLKETHQIAEIATHPSNPDIVYVAAVGHLWGFTGERGLYKTEDGGKSWTKLLNGLPDDPKTGCTEIIMHPENPNILFAGFYERLRQPASFYSGGPNGGLFKSEDGGKSWRKITNGLARGHSGMIDVSIHLADPKIMVMAYEADENLPEDEPGTGVYRSDDGGESWQFLLKHAVRPFYHGQIQIDPVDPNNIYVVSRGFMISRDGGKTFDRPRWNSAGGDDHDMWIAPYDNKIMYLATDQGARLSIDGGQNFLSFDNMAIGQYYAIGVDMRDPYYVIGGLQDNGLWMGPSNSRERHGILNQHNTWVGEGDGFHSQIDPTDWRTIYMVNHVGFAARLNLETREHTYITPTPETTFNFDDYFDPHFDEEHNRYTIDPGEHWFFYERVDRPLLPPQFRFNWSSPLVLSPIDPNTVFFGSNHLFKSTNRGESWEIVSPDLTTNDPALRNTSDGGGLTNSNTGGENHFTIITIDPSPIDENVIWVGTDDGRVQVTKDGGKVWTDVKDQIPGVPDKIWVSRVEASNFYPGRAYVSLDNHRFDDNRPYIFKTENYGQSWTPVTNGLPSEYSVYVVVEDPVSPNLLFAGTEQGVYTSLNGGGDWVRLNNNLPTVAIHDLIVHPRDGDLIAGTHGRSIWILDDVSPLRQLSETSISSDLALFDNRIATQWISINTGRKQPAFIFRGENPNPGAMVNFYVGSANIDTIDMQISDWSRNRFTQRKLAVHPGLNRTYWNMVWNPTKEEIAEYKDHLMEVISIIRRKDVPESKLSKLDDLESTIQTAESMRIINAQRAILVKEFGGYAGGETLFGKKLMRKTAEPGVYRIRISMEGSSAEGFLTIRQDPLKN